MTYKDFEHFRQILVDKRANVLNRSLGIEAGWRALKEPDPELEEEAQKMSLTGLYDQLEFRDKREIDEIDHALLKIGEGTFGHCERCRRPISRARLEALPEARFCLGCARRFESRTSRPNPGSEAISCSEAPSGYEDLSDEDLVELVREALRNDGSVDMQELEVTCEGGTIGLDGVLPNEEEHHIVLRILLDMVCSGSIVDRVEIREVRSGEEKEMPERFVPEPGTGIPLGMDEEEMTGDPFEMQEEDILFDVPDRPPAERFQEEYGSLRGH